MAFDETISCRGTHAEQWAYDQCVDIWQNSLGLPLPPKLGLPQPDFSGFLESCMSSFSFCSEPDPFHKWCGDGCAGSRCIGAGGRIFFCPTPSPGLPVAPSPAPLTVPIPGPIFVIP